MTCQQAVWGGAVCTLEDSDSGGGHGYNCEYLCPRSLVELTPGPIRHPSNPPFPLKWTTAAAACLAVVIALCAVRWYTDPASTRFTYPSTTSSESHCSCVRFPPSAGLLSQVWLTFPVCAIWGTAGRYSRKATGRQVSSPLLQRLYTSTTSHGTLAFAIQYPRSAFKIAMPDQWVVVLSGRDMVEELRTRPSTELSGTLGLHEVRGCVL